MKPTIIYALVDPVTNEARYVGKTKCGLNRRLSAHIVRARKSSSPYVYAWINKLTKLDRVPLIIELENVPPDGDWREAESFWIGYLKMLGASLTNMTAGGDGIEGYSHSQELREHWRKTRRGENHWKFGKVTPAEQRARAGKKLAETWKRRGHPSQGKKRTPEQRERMRQARLNGRPVVRTPEAAEAHKEAMKARWRDPAWRKRFSSLMSGPLNPMRRARND